MEGRRGSNEKEDGKVKNDMPQLNAHRQEAKREMNGCDREGNGTKRDGERQIKEV